MKKSGYLLALVLGLLGGSLVTLLYVGQPKPLTAASNDRYQDFVMATGAVQINVRVQTDGVWLLDYKSGKLLGTVIEKSQGKIIGWAEVDLVDEFKVQPKQDVHFMMTTGYITQGQSALYVAETSTGQFGVYTMAAGPNGSGIIIKRHDLTSFRKPIEATPFPLNPQPAPTIPGSPAPGAPGIPGIQGAIPIGPVPGQQTGTKPKGNQ